MAPELPPFTARDFPAEPALQCDIVMKGGITSGVVYPLAVCELATTYRLRSVGGASAGAIAAAAAAAAELGRQRSITHSSSATTTTSEPDEPTLQPGAAPQPDAAAMAAEAVLPPGFLGLARFPELLTQAQPDGRSLLYHLFRPQPAAERLFELVTGAIECVSSQPEQATLADRMRLVSVLARGLMRKTPFRSLLGAALGLVVVGLAVLALLDLPEGSGLLTTLALWAALLVGILVALLGTVTGAITGILRDLRALPAIGFGISAGRGTDDDQLALTPWLYFRLQELAGRPNSQPLTFADLAEHGLRLQVMTTNLSRQQPMVMPWDDDIWFFDQDRFTELFGPTLVAHLVAHPPPLPDEDTPRRDRELLLTVAAARGLRPLPRAADLPLIVPTRMSLSFPLLISAVPLHAVDWNLPVNRDYWQRASRWRADNPEASEAELAGAVAPPVFDVNWFSDGGLTSNLPVQFFDSALPTRPTFAIDLAPFGPDRERSDDERCNSSLPDVNVGGLHRRTSRWEGSALTQLGKFGVALVNTARNWVDQASLVMPGYRDRVVTVYQDKVEGGLNLSMPAPVVQRLSVRGRYAAERLTDRFGPTAPGWPNHRWIRFRTATAALSDWLQAFERGYTADPRFYNSLLCDPEAQPSYEISGERLDAARRRVAGLRAEIEAWNDLPADAFIDGRPEEPPVLRLVPRTDVDTVAGHAAQTGARTGAQTGARTGAETGARTGAETGAQTGAQTAANGVQTVATEAQPGAQISDGLP